MKNNELAYLVISCRKANDDDLESHFIINDTHYLIQAIEKSSGENIDQAEEKLKQRFPKNLLMTTFPSLLEDINLSSEILELESELALSNNLVYSKKEPDKIMDAFNWEQKHNPVRQTGSC